MKLLDYIKDQIVLILLYFTMILLVQFFLVMYHLPATLKVSLLIIMILFLLIVISYDYYRKSFFYQDFQKKLDQLDKKCLISALITRPNFLEGQILYDSLYEIDKATYEEIEKYQQEVSDFKEIYSLANKAAESVLNQTRFVKLTSEEQATVLRKIFDAYYDYAKAEVLGLDLVSRASKIIDMTDGQINIAKYIAYAQDLSDITGSDRKQQIEKKLKVYYLSEFEKEMVLYLSGYEI